jgi:rhamnose transport system permease protein
MTDASSAAATAPGARHAQPDPSAARLVTVISRIRELGIVAALGALVAYTALRESRFIEADSLRDLGLNAALFATLAVGQTMVIVTRNIDLSVGSMVALSAYLTGRLLMEHPGIPLPLLVVLAIAFGAALGVVNGLVVTFGRVPSLVATLGTLYVFRGAMYLWTDGDTVNAAEMPRSFTDLGTQQLLGVPVLVIVALVVVVLAGVALREFGAGRELYAIGSNPAAARLAGIRIDRRVFQAYVINGAIVGLVGVMFAARFASITSTSAQGDELTVVAAAVVGGVAIFGGSGSVYGAALGALLLSTITSALIVLKIDQFWQGAFVGGLLLAAISLDRLIAVRAERALRKRSAH